MTESEETAYLQGSNAAWKSILFQALKNLGTDSPEWTAQRWQLERADLVHTLRSVCAECGDNDWPDNLHLTDVIEKHLRPYLRKKR